MFDILQVLETITAVYMLKFTTSACAKIPNQRFEVSINKLGSK